MKNISACCTAGSWLVVCLLAALHFNLQAQGFTYPKQMDEVYVDVTLNGLTFDARASLHNPVRFRFLPKNLTFTLKTQHRRSWPQPLSAEAAAASPLSFFGEGPGVRPPFFFNTQTFSTT